MDIVYLTTEQAIAVHQKTIAISGGGVTGILDIGPLDGVLKHIQNDDYYPTIESKLAHLFFSACKFHCFMDGNKRVAITLCAQMMLFNGYLGFTGPFIIEAENISYHVAAGIVSKELLLEWFTAVLNGSLKDDESLKLKILQAMSGGTP